MKTIELYPHNQETYDKIQNLWKTENKVAAVQATGTGKSYLMLKCIYNTPEANKVVLAPSNYILEQIEKEAGEQLPNTKLLTYAKLSFMNDAEIKELNVEYIFLDEFHRCGAEQWGDGVQRLLNIFPNAKVLGTSATHIRFLDNARNMGEELFNGNIANNLSLAEAIVKKILPMPKYISALYTFDDEVNNLKTKVENSKNDEESKKEMLKEIELMKHKLNKSKGIPNILKKHLSNNYNGKFIIFCKNKIHLDEMKEIVVEWFKHSKVTKEVDIYSVYSNYEYGNAEVEAFINNKNPKSVKLLFSIEMFNEGIHIEDVTGVILLRPTVSPIIYYQQIGRAMQAGKDNVPVIFDLVNNFDNIGAKNFVEDLEKEVKLENEKQGKDDDKNDDAEKGYVDISEFMIFDETLEARGLFLKIEDSLIDNWDAKYEKLKEFYIKNGNCNIPKLNDRKLYSWASNQRECYKNGTLSSEYVNKLEDINFMWDIYEEKWDIMYSLLSEHKIKNGNCEPPTGNRQLDSWIFKQRNFKRNRLSDDQINKLNKLDFVWNQLDKNWDNTFEILIRYLNHNNSLGIKQNQEFENIKLGLWVSRQRICFKNGSLSTKQIEKLKSIGFFDIIPTEKKTWDAYYNECIKYTDISDIAIISKDDKKLAFWLYKQRNQKQKLPTDKIEKLNKLGMVWENQNPNPTWDETYLKLKEICIANNYDYEEVKKDKQLNSWIQTQKTSNVNNKLNQDKIHKLNEINFIWSNFNEQWNIMYKSLIEFKNEHNTCIMSQGDVYFDKNLYNWVCRQRSDYKNNKLENEKVEKLQRIGFIFENIDLYNWKGMFDLLKQYNDEYGHTNTSKGLIYKEKPLDNWILTQRQRYKKGVMSKYEISQLESLGFKWQVLEENWNSFYEELINYKNEHSNLSITRRFITKDGCKLGNWVFNQRKSYNQNKMSEERIQKLNDIGFIW